MKAFIFRHLFQPSGGDAGMILTLPERLTDLPVYFLQMFSPVGFVVRSPSGCLVVFFPSNFCGSI